MTNYFSAICSRGQNAYTLPNSHQSPKKLSNKSYFKSKTFAAISRAKSGICKILQLDIWILGAVEAMHLSRLMDRTVGLPSQKMSTVAHGPEDIERVPRMAQFPAILSLTTAFEREVFFLISKKNLKVNLKQAISINRKETGKNCTLVVNLHSWIR